MYKKSRVIPNNRRIFSELSLPAMWLVPMRQKKIHGEMLKIQPNFSDIAGHTWT